MFAARIVPVSLARTPAAADLTLVTDGRSDYVIVVSARAFAPEQRPANERQSPLRHTSGAEMPIAAHAADLPARTILVGRTRHTDVLGVKPSTRPPPLKGGRSAGTPLARHGKAPVGPGADADARAADWTQGCRASLETRGGAGSTCFRSAPDRHLLVGDDVTADYVAP